MSIASETVTAVAFGTLGHACWTDSVNRVESLVEDLRASGSPFGRTSTTVPSAIFSHSGLGPMQGDPKCESASTTGVPTHSMIQPRATLRNSRSSAQSMVFGFQLPLLEIRRNSQHFPLGNRNTFKGEGCAKKANRDLLVELVSG